MSDPGLPNLNLTERELAEMRERFGVDTPWDTLLGVPDQENYPPVLKAGLSPSSDDYDPAGNDQEATDA